MRILSPQIAFLYDSRGTHFNRVAWMLTCLFYVLTIRSLTSAHNSAAAECNGAGYVDYRSLISDPSKAERSFFEVRWKFEFSTSNGLWRIHLDEPKQKLEVDYSFDGTNTYIAMPTGTNLAAQIFPTQYPPPNGFPAIVVWFAYCSGDYLSRATDNLLCSLSQEAHPAMTAYDRLVRSEVEFLDPNSHIPRKYLEFSDGVSYGVDVTKRPPLIVGYRASGVFTNGFVKSAYSVADITNVDGLVLPKEFKLQQFRPRDGALSTNDVLVIAEFVGRLQTVKGGASNIGNGVQVQPDAVVSDYRGMKLDPPVELIQYLSPSNSWLTFSPGSLPYAIYENSKLIQTSSATQFRYKRALVVGILLALTAVPLIAMLARTSGKHTAVNTR